jgi:hypothetical protein
MQESSYDINVFFVLKQDASFVLIVLAQNFNWPAQHFHHAIPFAKIEMRSMRFVQFLPNLVTII